MASEQCTDTLVSAGTEIRGNVFFNGTMHVEGRVAGNLGSEQGQLTLSGGGAVEGDIRSPRIVINGRVRGNVYASEHLELAAQKAKEAEEVNEKPVKKRQKASA